MKALTLLGLEIALGKVGGTYPVGVGHCLIDGGGGRGCYYLCNGLRKITGADLVGIRDDLVKGVALTWLELGSRPSRRMKGSVKY